MISGGRIGQFSEITVFGLLNSRIEIVIVYNSVCVNVTLAVYLVKFPDSYHVSVNTLISFSSPLFSKFTLKIVDVFTFKSLNS